MFDRVQAPESIVLEFAARAQSKLLPFIRNQRKLQHDLSAIIEDKGAGHYAYGIDEFANRILFEILREYDLSCHVFSEEGGWSTCGSDPQYYVICDPYCNSSLTMNSFRESAVALSIADRKGELVACAIGDLQIDRIFYADQTGAYSWDLSDDGQWLKSMLRVSSTEKLDEAFVVTSLLKPDRRSKIAASLFYREAKTLHGVDGAIMIGRLAAGHIDAYLDPFKGQPLYEVPCCEMIVRAGGIVSDASGAPFRLSEIISGLREGSGARYRLVAASTPSLHQQILDSLHEQGSR